MTSMWRFVLFPLERRPIMNNSIARRRPKVTKAIREAYAKRDKRLDRADPEAPVLPPEMWDNAIVGKYFRPRKTAISLRIDNDVLAWLKSQGEGQLIRINTILRERMEQERRG